MKNVTKPELIETAQTLIERAIQLIEVATENDTRAQAKFADHLNTMTATERALDTLVERYQEDGSVKVLADLTTIVDYINGR